jgi:AcrR family transcriptional regulator
MVATDRAKARRERAQALARQDILEAALRAFAKKGYAATKMADIAAEAGFTAASLYTYFPGKREIFQAAAEHFVEAVKAAYGPRPERPVETVEALEAELRARMRSLCAFGDSRHEVLGFFLRMRWAGVPPEDDVAVEARGPQVGLCRDGVSEGEAATVSDRTRAYVPGDGRTEQTVEAYFEGLWRDLGVERFGVKPALIATLVGACIESFFARRYLLGGGGTLSEDADAIADLLLFGMLGRQGFR